MSNATVFTAPDPDLADLWGRAIASDTDREAWLGKRRTGLTGTDMKVVSRSRPQTVREHLRKKVSETDAEFRGNRNTEWGHYREDVIVSELDGSEYHRCGLLLQSTINPRYLVTPDLVGVDFGGELEVIEVKTAEKKDLNPAGPDFAGTRYFEQILWEMIVTGAARVLLLVEEHDGDWSRWNDRPQGGRSYQDGMTLTDYGPGIVARHQYTFERAELGDEIAAMLTKAEQGLVILDEELTGFVAAGPEEFTVEQQRVYGAEARKYADGAAAEKAGKAKKEAARDELLALGAGWDAPELAEVDRGAEVELMGRRAFSERFDNVKVTYSPSEPGAEIEVDDVEAAKAADPKAWERVEQAKAALTAAVDQWDAVQAKHKKKKTGAASAAKVTVTAPKGATK